jgi:hypothetical protein
MKYVYLDTCVIVDCAFTRKEKSSPKFLERLMERLGDNGVKLILPEVVQLELEKVLPQTMSVAVESFGAVKKSVQEVAENSLLSHSAKTKLLDAVKAARAELNSDVKDALDLINHISNESDRCVVLPLIQEDIIVATKMAIKGNKPSKSKAAWGLVQEDCLIVAALERFMSNEPGAEVAICSSNTDDFAMKTSDGKGYTLHEQIASRLGGCRYYSNPVDLMTDETFMSKENEEIADKETLKSSYEAASQAIKTMSQKNAESVAAASRALLKYNLSNHYSDMAAQIPSSLSKVGLATDSFAKISAMARQNQLNALSSYLEAIDSIKWNQIGPAYSALDNVGFGETDGEGIEDDAE